MSMEGGVGGREPPEGPKDAALTIDSSKSFVYLKLEIAAVHSKLQNDVTLVKKDLAHV